MNMFSRIPQPINAQQNTIYLNLAEKIFNQNQLSPAYKTTITVMLLKAGLVKEAIPLIKQNIQLDPRNNDAISLLGQAFESLNDPKSAVQYRQKLLELDPFGAENLLQLEKDYLSLGDKLSARRIKMMIQRIAPNTEIAIQSKNVH
jgi:tetratricopeptide (TPR) repeat protein